MAPKRSKEPVPDPEDNGQYEVDKIVKHKKVDGEYQFYVTWKGYGSEEDCWVESDDMNCPETVDAYFRSLDAKKAALRTPAERHAETSSSRTTRVKATPAKAQNSALARVKATPAKGTPAKGTPAKETPAKIAKNTPAKSRATPAKPIAKATPARAAKMTVVSSAKKDIKESAKQTRTGSRVNAEKKRKAVDEEVEETPKRRRPMRGAETSRAFSSRSGQSSSTITSTIEEQSDDDEAEETSKQVPTDNTDFKVSLIEAYERASQVMAISPRPIALTRPLSPVIATVEEGEDEEEEVIEPEPSPASPPSAEDPKSRCVIS